MRLGLINPKFLENANYVTPLGHALNGKWLKLQS
jgi:hypothetical protein